MSLAPNLYVNLSVETARFTAALEQLQRTMALQLQPAIEAFAASIRELYYDLPGMPYTAPSLWDADQMRPAP